MKMENGNTEQKARNPKAWEKPAGVVAGFLAFNILCGVVDTNALAANYTVREPITLVKKVYVDPKEEASGEECLIDTRGNDFAHLNALDVTSKKEYEPLKEKETQAQAGETEASSAQAASSEADEAQAAAASMPAASTARSAASAALFRNRYESLRVLAPPAPDVQPAIENPAVETQLTLEDVEEDGDDGAAAASGRARAVSIDTSTGTGFARMSAWKQKNSDVMGFLTIPGTNIDYPVVQGPTNSTYLSLGYDKNYSYNGVIWADQDVTTRSRNTILYGHNWTNYSANPRIGNPADVMFAQLTAYQHLSFAQSHPTIQYANANGDGTYVVFATLYTTDLNFYINTNSSPASLAAKAKSMSLHDFSVDVKDSDSILTLSTCTRYFGKFENQRFVVMARKLRKGENLSSIQIG